MADQPVTDIPARITAPKEFPDGEGIAVAASGFFPVMDDQFVVEPVVGGRPARGRPADGDGNGSAVCDVGAYEGWVQVWRAYLPLIFKE